VYALKVFKTLVRNILKSEHRVIRVEITLIIYLISIFIDLRFLNLGVSESAPEIVYALSLEEFIGSVFHTVIRKIGKIVYRSIKAYGKSCAWGYLAKENIGKGVAWQNVTDGLGNIISKLESGAKAAVNFGKKIIQSAKGSTGYADEIKTIVAQYEDMGLTTDSYQRMKNVEEFIDTPVDAILTARQRMQKAAASNNGRQTLEETLGIKLGGQSADDLFWEVGNALMNMGDAFDKESAAQTMFGRSWRELMPLFKAGREEYEKSLSEQNVLTEEQIESLSKADDAFK
jgi:hypothetical protein